MGYDLVSEIKNLKQKHDFAILAHYYEDGEIQDLADFVGDSYQLAIQAKNLKQQNILMAGVVFMAESVKLLSPQKNVFVPDLNAGCSLVNDSPYEKYLAWRKLYPDGIAVTYVNSSVAVKSISDVIVTSSNAEKIIRSLPADRPILFGPDKNLGKFLQKITERKMEIWQGACQVHVLFSAKRLHQLISENPDAVVIAHPECDEPVLAYATVIGSTSKLLDEVKNNPAKKFIVATETGILHQMQKSRPEAVLIQAPVDDETCACNNCPYMKLNTLEKIKKTMIEKLNPISINAQVQERAKLPLQRMVDIVNGKPVQFSERFM